MIARGGSWRGSLAIGLCSSGLYCFLVFGVSSGTQSVFFFGFVGNVGRVCGVGGCVVLLRCVGGR